MFSFPAQEEYIIRGKREGKLSLIFEQFGADNTGGLLNSEDGAHMIDKLFIDPLLNPNKFEDEIDSVTMGIL